MFSSVCIRVNNKSSYDRQIDRIIQAFDVAVWGTEEYLNALSSANISVSQTATRQYLQHQLSATISSIISGGQVHFELGQCTGTQPQLGSWNC